MRERAKFKSIKKVLDRVNSDIKNNYECHKNAKKYKIKLRKKVMCLV